MKQDQRRQSQNDRLKHIVSELNIANSALQLAMCDLSHFMKDEEEMLLKEEKENEYIATDKCGETAYPDSKNG